MPARRVDVLLVGGGVASVRCARALRRHGFAGSILLVGDEPHLPYNRPPLSKELLRGEVDLDLVVAEQAAWYARRGIELLRGVSVVSLEPVARRAGLSSGDEVRFGRCLLATGASPRRPAVPGAQQALLLRTLDDASVLREHASEGARVVVIGAGFIGVEVASSLATRGAVVIVLELGDAPWGGTMGAAPGGWAAARLEHAGVELRLGTAASRIERDAVWVSDERIAGDLVLAGVGVVPNDGLALDAGLVVDGGIVTDAWHATSAPDVFAAGDAARVDGVRVEHWHAAREGGERAALAMLGLEPAPRPPAWIFSEVAGTTVDVVGLAASGDEEIALGSPETDRFAVAWRREGSISQCAIVGGALPVTEVRALLGRGGGIDELRALAVDG